MNTIKSYATSICFLLLTASMFAVAALWPSPPKNGEEKNFAIFFSPDTSRVENILKIFNNGANPLRFGFADNVLIAKTSDTAFIKNITNDGAMLVTATTLRGGCFDN